MQRRGQKQAAATPKGLILYFHLSLQGPDQDQVLGSCTDMESFRRCSRSAQRVTFPISLFSLTHSKDRPTFSVRPYLQTNKERRVCVCMYMHICR